MFRTKKSNGPCTVINDYTNSRNNEKNCLIDTKRIFSSQSSTVRPSTILSTTNKKNTKNTASHDRLSQSSCLEQGPTVQEAFVNDPQKSYLLSQQSKNDKLLLSPLSPSAYNRSTKIRFRCPSVDLIVSPSTASAYSSEDCAEVSADSWDESPLDDEYNLLFGEKNEFPLSYSIMEEVVHISEAAEISGNEEVSLKKPMNGHVPRNEPEEEDNVDDREGSRRGSKLEENGVNVKEQHSNAGSRRTSKADSSKNDDEQTEEVHQEIEVHENVENYDTIGDNVVETEEGKNEEENGEVETKAEDEIEEQTRKLSTTSAKSEDAKEESAEDGDGEHQEENETTEPQNEEEEEIRRESVGELTSEEKHEEQEEESHQEMAESVHDEKEQEEHEQIEEVGEEKPVEEEVAEEAAAEEQAEEEKPEVDGVEDDTAKSERGSEPAEELFEAEIEQAEAAEVKKDEETEVHEGEEGKIIDGENLVNGVVAVATERATRKIRQPKTSTKSSGSPRKSPRHVGGPPLRGRPRGAGRQTGQAPSTTETRLNQSWNSGVRRTQSQSPGRSTSEDIGKMAKQVDLHSIFGKTEAQVERRKHREEISHKKRAEEEEKLIAEKEQRRKDAEAAFQSWLRRKAQERRRARSTGRGSTQSESIDEKSETEKQKNRMEAEQAFQAWLDRKKEEQKERKRHLVGASKSQQHISSREDADEAFRHWKEQKEQQRREERRLVRAQMRELQTVVPIDKYGDTSRSIRRTNYNVYTQNGLPKLNHFRIVSPSNRKRVVRSDSLPSITSPDGAVRVA